MKTRVLARYGLRELRASWTRSLFFLICLAVGVTAVTGVAALTSSVRDGMASRSRELLAADVAVSAWRALPPELDALLAGEVGLRRTSVREFRTNAAAPAADGGVRAARLVEVKVVEPAYPFYGRPVLEPARPLHALLEADAAVVGPELLTALDLEIGDELLLGGQPFRIAGVVLEEPDRLEIGWTLGPRVFLDAAGAERSGLLTFGSRVQSKLLLALPPSAAPDGAEALARRIERALGDAPWLRIDTHEDAQPMIRRAMHRIDRYVGLIALLSLLLGGIGVGQTVRTWIAAKLGDFAILRCLGFRPRDVFALEMVRVLALAAIGSALGAAIGLLFPRLIALMLPDLVPPALVAGVPLDAAWHGIALGMAIAAAFALPPLTAVWRIPPARVLRHEAEPLPPRPLIAIIAWGVLAIGAFGAALLQVEREEIALTFVGGFALTLLALLAAARATMWIAARLPRRRLGFHLGHGLAALARPSAGTVQSVAALGLGVLVIATVTLVERDLGRGLADAIPADAPTVFMLDVQPDQWPDIERMLRARDASGLQSLPIVTARLRAIDGVEVGDLVRRARREERSSWVYRREHRLTWREDLAPGNALVAGELWARPDVAEISVETDFAEDLGVGLGSRLVFDVLGVPIELVVTSLRSVRWETFGINFFMVAEPGTLDEAPHLRIAVAHLDEQREAEAENALLAAHPNVTMIRIRPILTKVAELIDRLSIAVRVLGGFTLVAGLAILAGGVAATSLRRRREAALLKTLGATRRNVVILFSLESAFVGWLAGAIGILAGAVLAHLFVEELLDLQATLPVIRLLVAFLLTGVATAICGVLASIGALRAAPIETLRRADH